MHDSTDGILQGNDYFFLKILTVEVNRTSLPEVAIFRTRYASLEPWWEFSMLSVDVYCASALENSVKPLEMTQEQVRRGEGAAGSVVTGREAADQLRSSVTTALSS